MLVEAIMLLLVEDYVAMFIVNKKYETLVGCVSRVFLIPRTPIVISHIVELGWFFEVAISICNFIIVASTTVRPYIFVNFLHYWPFFNWHVPNDTSSSHSNVYGLVNTRTNIFFRENRNSNWRSNIYYVGQTGEKMTWWEVKT